MELNIEGLGCCIVIAALLIAIGLIFFGQGVDMFPEMKP